MSSYQQTCENCFQDTIIKVGVSDLRALLKQCFGGVQKIIYVYKCFQTYKLGEFLSST